MSKKDLLTALEIITEKQYKDDKHFGCAPVSLEIGYVTDKHMVQNGLLIKGCPPCIVDALKDHGYVLAVGHGGLLVDKF